MDTKNYPTNGQWHELDGDILSIKSPVPCEFDVTTQRIRSLENSENSFTVEFSDETNASPQTSQLETAE